MNDKTLVLWRLIESYRRRGKGKPSLKTTTQGAART